VEILPSTLPPTQAILRLAPADLIRGWVVGQVLEATVLAVTAPDRAVLALAGRRFEAQTQPTLAGAPLRSGQQLTLRVDSKDSPVVLTVLRAPDSPAASAPGAPAAEIQRAALREALPRATPIGPALEAAARLAEPPSSPPGVRSPALPEDTMHALRQLLRAVPEAGRLATASGLRTAVEDSGLFLESRLASLPPGVPPPTGDLKAALLMLSELLSRATANLKALGHPPPGIADAAPPPPGNPRAPSPSAAHAGAGPAADAPTGEDPALLAIRVEGALARVELNQLRSVPLADAPHPGWLVEIPVRTPGGFDQLTLHVEREGRERRGRPPEAWQASVRLDLEALGPIHATVRWQAGALSATLRAERAATAALLERHAPGLIQALSDAGLPNAAVHCLRAPVPDVVGQALPERLLDLQA
jgi:hypothetical protein